MADRFEIDDEWLGRLVRVLVVFRAFVLLVTLIVLPARQQTPVVAAAVVLAALFSYLPLKHWRRIGPSVSRHPLYLAAEALLATLVLAAAGARSPFFYFTLGTAALAGVVYGRRGAAPFSALLIAAYELVAIDGLPNLHPLHDVQSVVFIPFLYPVAVAAGVAARGLIQRGVQAEALLRERTDALSAERERLRVARELHDSLAKTVEGLALSASVLPGRCLRNPAAASELARQLAADARQAALEARGLMSDLRPETRVELSLEAAIRQRAESFAQRSGIQVDVSGKCPLAGERLPAEATHELVRIVGEALTNAVTHGGAASAAVSVEEDSDGVAVRVSDDGSGLPEAVDLERLKAGGHFGLAGMDERAREIGGFLHVQRLQERGTTVTVRVPVPEASASTQPSSVRRRLRAAWRRRVQSPLAP